VNVILARPAGVCLHGRLSSNVRPHEHTLSIFGVTAMSARIVVSVFACIAGVASGPSTLEAGTASVPPIEWSILPLLFIGSAVGPFLVLALQSLREKDWVFSLGWRLFAVGTVYAVTAGISAVATAAFRSATGPSMFAVLAIGLGMSVGLWALKVAFASKLRGAA
jgi:hypothetical protein